MKYEHYETCPSYIVDKGSSNCTCERMWEITGMEKIEAHIENLFKHADEPTLFQWAGFANGFDAEDEGEELPEIED